MDRRLWQPHEELGPTRLRSANAVIEQAIIQYIHEAAERTQRAVTMKPGAAQGHILLQQKRYRQAIDVFLSCLETNPNCYISLSGMAMIALRKREHEEATHYTERQLKLRPNAREDKYELFAALLTKEAVERTSDRMRVLEIGKQRYKTATLTHLCLLLNGETSSSSPVVPHQSAPVAPKKIVHFSEPKTIVVTDKQIEKLEQFFGVQPKARHRNYKGSRGRRR